MPASSRSVPTTLGRLLVGVGALVFASPAVLMVLGSLRGRGQPPPRGVEVLPSDPSLTSFEAVLAALPWETYLRNSVLVVLVAVPVSVLVASLAGWGIRLLPRRPKRTAIGVTLLALLVPVTAVWATRFELFRLVGAVDSLLPLWSLSLLATSPFYVLVYAWAYHRIDGATYEAAALDGAGPLRTWWAVAMPQVRPVTLAVGVLTFVVHWGDFLNPLLYLSSPTRYTAPLGLRLLQQLAPTDWPLLMAASTMLALPAVAVFLVGQRVFLHDPLHMLDEARR